jgi:hypothetical protein
MTQRERCLRKTLFRPGSALLATRNKIYPPTQRLISVNNTRIQFRALSGGDKWRGEWSRAEIMGSDDVRRISVQLKAGKGGRCRDFRFWSFTPRAKKVKTQKSL